MNGSSHRNTGSIKISKLSFVYIILSVLCTFSLLVGWVPILHKQAFVTTIVVLLSVLIVPQYFRTRLFLITLFYAIVVWLNAQMGDEYAVDKRVLDGLLLCTCGCVSYYLMNSDDQKVKKWISILVLSVLIIQTVIGLFIYSTSQEALRFFIEAMNHDAEDFDMLQIFRMGVLSYDVTHGLPLLVPPLMMWIRTKDVSKLWKAFCILCLLCIVTLTYIYDVTTVLILVVFCFGCSFLIKPNQDKKNRHRIIIVSLLILPFMLSSTLQKGVLGGVESLSMGTTKDKIAAIKESTTSKDDSGDVGTRKERYGLSLSAFMSNPIMGTNNNAEIGEHSAVFDRMGAFGLIGFIPYLLILILSTKCCRINMTLSCRWFFILCTISFTALIVLKNMSRIEEWFMYLVVAPSLLTLKFENQKR